MGIGVSVVSHFVIPGLHVEARRAVPAGAESGHVPATHPPIGTHVPKPCHLPDQAGWDALGAKPLTSQHLLMVSETCSLEGLSCLSVQGTPPGPQGALFLINYVFILLSTLENKQPKKPTFQILLLSTTLNFRCESKCRWCGSGMEHLSGTVGGEKKKDMNPGEVNVET